MGIFKLVQSKRGRDDFYKCTICGRYIAYDDFPDDVEYELNNEDMEPESVCHSKCKYIERADK